MDFVEGETLMARLRKTGPLSWEQAQAIFFPAIRAMEQVHQEGLIHRDLSPDNLMLLPNGDVRILDLGAAKDLNINSGASSMQVAKGGFSPLEQYTQRGGSGTWSDVYAMAATMYYSLTGVLPPASVDRVETDSLRWDLPALTALPQNVLKALQQALGVFVKDRTQTMGAFLSALESRTPQGKKSQGKPKTKKKKSPVKGILAAILLITLAIGGYLGYSAWQGAQYQKLLCQDAQRLEERQALLRTGALGGSATETALQPTKTEQTVPEETFDLSASGYARPYRMWGDDSTSEIYSVMSYDLENGQTKFIAELLAPSGKTISAFTYTEEGDAFEWTCRSQTTGKKQTVTFDIPTDILANARRVYLDIEGRVAEIAFDDFSMYRTAGKPIGEKTEFSTTFEYGHYYCHNLTSQRLDNDYIRFTMEFTAPAGLRLIFCSDDRFGPNYVSDNVTVEGRQTFVWDVPAEFFADATSCVVAPEDWDTMELENDYISLNPPFWQ